MKRIFILAFLFLLSTNQAYTQEINSISASDKIQIITSVLLKTDFLNRGLRLGERKEVVYLSSENLPPNFKPKIRRIKFVLVNPEEIEKRSKEGFGYYAFGKFEIKSSRILVSFHDLWRSPLSRFNLYRETEFEYGKVSDRWKMIKLTNFTPGSP
jgi:predicted nuclease of predicted toxin-antitoxin system